MARIRREAARPPRHICPILNNLRPAKNGPALLARCFSAFPRFTRQKKSSWWVSPHPTQSQILRGPICVLLLGGIETIIRSFSFLSFSLSLCLHGLIYNILKFLYGAESQLESRNFFDWGQIERTFQLRDNMRWDGSKFNQTMMLSCTVYNPTAKTILGLFRLRLCEWQDLNM